MSAKTSKLETSASRLIRDAYDAGRTDLYGELIDECIEKGRRAAALWLLDRLGAEMYLLAEKPEHLQYVEDLRERIQKMKGST